MQTDVPHILIIDDDPVMLKALPEILRRQVQPLQITTFNSPHQALNIIAITDFDAIISDIKMPGMDGLTLLTEIHRINPELPVLMMTAEDDREVLLRALRGGAYDFILKPIVDHDYVVASLQRAMKTRQLSRQVAAQKKALEHHASELEKAVAEAVAEAKAAQRRLSFLAEASNLLAASLDYETTLTRVARLAVLYLADYCIVDMVQEDGTLHTVGLAHRDRTQEGLVHRLREGFEVQSMQEFENLSQTVRQTGHGILQPYMDDETLAKSVQDANELQLLRALGPRSLMRVPLQAQDKILGMLSFVSTRSDRHYGHDDLALAEDLTRRAALAVNNSRLYNEAQQALRVRDQFLSIAAHELKTPITSIMGTAQLLQRSAEREGNTNPRDTRRMQLLTDQTRRLNRLLDSLLNLSRLEAGQLTIDQAEVNIVALAQRVSEEMKLALESHMIEFHSDETKLAICGDELRLEQVLQNLLQNAIKYSPDGGIIRIHVQFNNHMAEVSVTDQGIGISDEAMPFLFSRFFRADSPTAKQISGIGLGLYVVKEIVTMHGGSIQVVSTQNQGSTFTIRLPLFDSQAT